jgi:DMSO/TMAO reductase YedYZ molybdopterin-dependent catalytic subunit
MKRRQFNRIMAGACGQILLSLSPFSPLAPRIWASSGKRRLTPDTDLGTLIYEIPSLLDVRELPITPVDGFGTAGLTEHPVDIGRWRLDVSGRVSRPQSLSYDEIRDLTTVERKVLLICPGAFAYHARWKGVSLWGLLEGAGVSEDATHVDIAGPDDHFQRFALKDIHGDRAFLAHTVNGIMLPESHGFPVRLVADGSVGAHWIKYVQRVEAVSSDATEGESPSHPGPAFLP